jgi:hypothetical protein
LAARESFGVSKAGEEDAIEAACEAEVDRLLMKGNLEKRLFGCEGDAPVGYVEEANNLLLVYGSFYQVQKGARVG